MCRNTCFQSELLLLLTSASSSRSKSPLTKFLFPVQQLLHCNFVTFSSINYTELNCLTINNVFQAFNHLRVFKSQRHSRSIHSLKQQCQKQARAPTTAGEERTQPSPRRHALPPPCCDALHAAQDAAWRFPAPTAPAARCQRLPSACSPLCRGAPPPSRRLRTAQLTNCSLREIWNALTEQLCPSTLKSNPSLLILTSWFLL